MTDQIKYISFDTETLLIDYYNPVPDIMCLTHAIAGENSGTIMTPWEYPLDVNMLLWWNKGHHTIAHNVCYDLSVMMWNYTHLVKPIWDALDNGLIHDTLIREKLLNLTLHGNMDMIEVNGAVQRVGYSLVDLERKYLNIDRSALKDDDDAPRSNYSIYKDVPVAQWREDFISYAIDDAVNCGQIFWHQEQARQKCIDETGYDPFATEVFRTRAAWALRLCTCTGSLLDGNKVREVSKFFTKEYQKPSLREPLIAAGLLIPEQPPQPYANGAVVHVEGCTNKKKGGCNCPPKMKAAEPEHSPRRPLFQHIWNLARTQPDLFKAMPADGCISKLKQSGEYDDVISGGYFKVDFLNRFPELPPDITLCVDGDWMAEYAALDPLLSVLDDRNKVKKIITDYLPKMYYTDPTTGVATPAVIIRCDYQPLMKTGRCSGRSSNNYPSWNDTNVDPRVRPCNIPRPGNVLVSTDISGMELGTLAQTCYNIFGYSDLRDKINNGVDVHAFLGAQIAYHMDEKFVFLCGSNNTKEAIYNMFKTAKGVKESCDQYLPAFSAVYRHEHPDYLADKPVLWSHFFDHYRKFAKPTGLGYPGGLGAATFVAYSKGTYGLTLKYETAKQLKEVWLSTYTEMGPYLEWISKQIDPYHSAETYQDDDGNTKKRTWLYYDTPLGMHRPKCSFCEAANGKGLQSPSAEGALCLALPEVSKLFWLSGTTDDKYDGLFNDSLLLKFIHDEVVWESPEDAYIGQRARIVEKTIVDNMQIITPDVKAGAESAAMRFWTKAAKSIWDGDKLVVWEPDEK